MKKLKLTIASVAVIFLTFAGKEDHTRGALTMRYALNTFVDAFSLGRIDGFAGMLDDNVKLISSRDNNTVTYDKGDILQVLKNFKGVVQNCKTSSSLIETLPGHAIVKVTMAYDSFTKINYVTLAGSSKGWKIVHISSVFQ